MVSKLVIAFIVVVLLLASYGAFRLFDAIISSEHIFAYERKPPLPPPGSIFQRRGLIIAHLQEPVSGEVWAETTFTLSAGERFRLDASPHLYICWPPSMVGDLVHVEIARADNRSTFLALRDGQFNNPR